MADGQAAPAVIYTCHHANNDEVFPLILQLYLPNGGRIADPTYGHGIFWRKVDLERWTCQRSDLVEGTDLRATPHADRSLDGWVIDPPYMHNPGRRKSGMPRDFYRNTDVKMGIRELLDLYRAGFEEARRCLKPKGVLITKCQDQISGGKQHFIHVDLCIILRELQFEELDLFVVRPRRKPFMDPRWGKQKHARKDHSYFLVHKRR